MKMRKWNDCNICAKRNCKRLPPPVHIKARCNGLRVRSNALVKLGDLIPDEIKEQLVVR